MITRSQSKNSNVPDILSDEFKQISCDLKKWKNLYNELEKNFEDLESDYREAQNQITHLKNEATINKNKIKILKDEKIYLEDTLTNLEKMIEEKDEKIIELKKDVIMLRTVKDDEKENLNEINLADELKCLDIEKPMLSSTPKKNSTKKENETFLNKSILDSFSNIISYIFPENNPSSHDIELIIMLDKEKMVSRYVAKKKKILFEGYMKFDSYRKDMFIGVHTLDCAMKHIEHPENTKIKLLTNIKELIHINSNNKTFRNMIQLIVAVEKKLNHFLSVEYLFAEKDDSIFGFTDTPKKSDFIKYKI